MLFTGQILSQILQPSQAVLDVNASDFDPFSSTCLKNFSRDGTILINLG
jgi:hypothetical protein